MAQAAAVTPASESKVNTFIAQVYLLMFVGLAITGVVSYWVSESLRFQYNLFTRPWLGFGIFILQIIVVVVLSARIMSMSTGASTLLFLFYAALVGLSLSSIFILYSQQQIYSVFFITSATFLVTGGISLVIKKDMSGSGHFLFMLLTGWLLAWMASWLFQWLFGVYFENVNWALNFVGIAIFVGLTAWDTQQLKKIGQQIGSHPARGGLVVIGALKLYLDYINLFLLMLRASNR
ncbi:MAG TPA: Bax inhibitor-1/YccA family protein [Anaerolineae bacterium]|jgi:FtsH-binding integral membrane protein|nr:Bax inhibitor-1/YccA family protein [Anaerolineae bacterium]